jgi:putative ABC transport system permease protein
MSALRRVVLKLFNVMRPGWRERELAREMSAHLALIEDDFIRRGMTREQARLAARRAFGGVEHAKDLHRDARSFPWLDDARRDVQYAIRTLRRSPGFAGVAVLTIALGIGANTAIFSVLDAVLLHPLPFKEADRLVRLYENVPASESPNGRPRRLGGIDAVEFLALRAQARTVSHVVAHAIALVSVSGGIDTSQRELTALSSTAFAMLGVQPILGRSFTPEEEQPGLDKVIVLSYAAWQRYFGGDPAVLGKALTFNGNTFSGGVALGDDYIVVGVMPPDFRFPDDHTQFWTPFPVTPPEPGRTRRLAMTARLADGVSPEAAAAEITSIALSVRGQRPGAVPDASGPPRFDVVGVQTEVGDSVRPALQVLTVAVAFVLLIACANVANLLLARAASRQREIAVRIAIGAGRGRLMRQLLTESLLLSAVGGAAGTLLAAAGVELFRRLATDLGRIDLGALGITFPRLDAIRINSQVLLFAMAISVGSGLLFGALPALRHAFDGRLDALRGRRLNAQDVLVVVEMALATVLFVASGLLIHSFVRLARVEVGYDPTNVLTFQVSLPGPRRPIPELKTAEDLVSRLRAIPGVQSAAYANQLPLVALENGLQIRSTAEPPPYPAQGPPQRGADARLVSRDYLQTMAIRVIAGRPFDDRDSASAPRVLIINRTLAYRDFSDGNPVGTIIYLGRDTAPWEIIGVVDDVRQTGLDREPAPQMFLSLEQWNAPQVPIFPAGAYYAIRSASEPSSAFGHVRDVVRQLDPRASLENVATMDQIIANRMTRPRMYAVLLGIFAAIAVALAAAGIYGVVAYSVSQRTREIGIRVALGARSSAVLRLVMGQSARLSIAGVVIGLAGAMWTTRYLQGLLFGLTPLDPATFAAVALLFLAVATAASYVPARRATTVDPSVALRAE